jgi:hypothetical protein
MYNIYGRSRLWRAASSTKGNLKEEKAFKV